MKQSNVKIAVAGGIGSGKSTVCKILKGLGFAVYSCDEVYGELLKGKELPAKIAKEFGLAILNADGMLNKRLLSKIAFENETRLKKLNEITHPEIFKAMFRQAENDNGIVFFEVPLLFEGGYQNLFDSVVVVLRDENSRIVGISKRDGLSDQEIRNRIKRQFNYANSSFEQYYVIHNNGKIDDLCGIIDKILSEITQKYIR